MTTISLLRMNCLLAWLARSYIEILKNVFEILTFCHATKMFVFSSIFVGVRFPKFRGVQAE